ncbi:MAG: hypothetical protein DWH79_08620 [Planctomycetota bacterium]|nr:MAG: hypothetical protein DWH79_08620 [Planctomycetota bacterium]
MRRKRLNPFSVLLGITGIVFTLTASCYCLFVLRAVRPETATATSHAFEQIIDRFGTTALVVELGLLAIATFGSIAYDELGFRDDRRALEEARKSRDGDSRGIQP